MYSNTSLVLTYFVFLIDGKIAFENYIYCSASNLGSETGLLSLKMCRGDAVFPRLFIGVL